MNTTLTIGRRLRRAIGVTTGTALIAGLSVAAVAPGALASGLDDEAAAVSQAAASETTSTDQAAEPAVAEEAPVEEAPATTAAATKAPANKAASKAADEAPVEEPVVQAEPAEKPGKSDKDSSDKDSAAKAAAEDEPVVEAGNPNLSCPTGTEAVAKFNFDRNRFEAEFGGDAVEIDRRSNEARGDFVVEAGYEISFVIVKAATDAEIVAVSGMSGSFDNDELVNNGGNTPAISNVVFCGEVAGGETTDPGTETTDPGTETTDPGTETTDPGTETTDPAASCPGIGDGVDYRTLFEYDYYASDGEGGYVLLGSTDSWTRPLSVEWFNRPVPAPVSTMMVRAVVTLKAGVDISQGECSYDFSLASYEAQGSTFSTSGQQVFIDHDTDTITADNTSITLVVDPAECFAQSDLYKTDKVYNGALTPRGPFYAPITRDGNMIANWMGGIGCEPEPAEDEPAASFESSCVDDVVTVTAILDNTLSAEETTFEVVADAQTTERAVAAGATDELTYTVELDEVLQLQVLADDEVLAEQEFEGEVCSAEPAATVTSVCVDDQLIVDLELSNQGTEGATFEVVVDGESTSVEVAEGASSTEQFEVAAGDVLDLQVLVGDEVLLDEVFEGDECLQGGVVEAVAVLVAECVDDELIVDLELSNEGTETVTFEVLLDGDSELVDVAADDFEVLELVLQQDETVTVEVLVDGEVLLAEEELSGEECGPDDGQSTPPPHTTPPSTPPAAGATTPGTQPRALARTGVETWTVALVAALFLAAGGALVALGGNTPRGRRQA